MATTRIIPMHRNDGKTASMCISERIEYAVDAQKTEGKYLSGYACDPLFADSQFILTQKRYELLTGRSMEKGVLMYQVRQSFAPGEVTAEEANAIGNEFARRFLKGKHAFIVATHTDKDHIHNHIIWNAVSLDCKKKWRDFLRSGKAVAKLSDQICLEHQLSVVEHPQWHHMSYNKWLGDKIRPTQRDILRAEIDRILEQQKPASFEDLLSILEANGYEVKNRGKNVSIKPPSSGRFLRLTSLDEGGAYSEKSLREVLSGDREHKPVNKMLGKQERSISMLIDIQQKLSEGYGSGYEQWAKVFNLKQMARSVSYLSDRKLLSYADLEKAMREANERYNALSEQIKAAEKRLAENAVLQKHITDYSKTRKTYIAYRESGYSKKFLAEHEAEITLHRAAKQAFDELKMTRIPTIKSLREEYARLLAEKKKAYSEFVEAKSEKRALTVAKANVDAILGNEREPLSRRVSEEHK